MKHQQPGSQKSWDPRQSGGTSNNGSKDHLLNLSAIQHLISLVFVAQTSGLRPCHVSSSAGSHQAPCVVGRLGRIEFSKSMEFLKAFNLAYLIPPLIHLLAPHCEIDDNGRECYSRLRDQGP